MIAVSLASWPILAYYGVTDHEFYESNDWQLETRERR